MINSVGKLQINLSAIQKNWRQFDEMTSATTAVAAVVKANAYGLGVEPVIQALLREGCEQFFVATLDEAKAAKKAVIKEDKNNRSAKIYILSGLNAKEYPSCVENEFIPVLYSLDRVQEWAEFCLSQKKSAPSAIKVDTGMHRLGLSENELSTLIDERLLLENCNPVLLMSHLACADDSNHPLNEKQLIQFRKNAQQFKQLFPHSKLSLANSSGAFLGEDYHFDIVRAGIGLYGGNPIPQANNPMAPVVALDLPIAQVKDVVGPASVGYGGTFAIAANEKIKIAIALGGYADGIFRSLSNSGSGVVGGVLVPIVGRVSMDSVIFNVSAVADKILLENKKITLIGAGNLVDTLAEAAGTIGYEVLTSLGHRYEREYVWEG